MLHTTLRLLSYVIANRALGNGTEARYYLALCMLRGNLRLRRMEVVLDEMAEARQAAQEILA